jgi:hypothetical protein
MSDQADHSQEQADAEAAAAAEAGAAREADLQTRLAAAERTNTFQSVIPGDKLGSDLGQLFTQGYRGDLTSEAITEAATKVGLLESPPDPNAGQSDGSTEERQQLRAGAEVPGHEPGPDPREEATMAGKEAWKRGTEADALSAHFGTIIHYAAAGDQRVILDYMNPRSQGAR